MDIDEELKDYDNRYFREGYNAFLEHGDGRRDPYPYNSGRSAEWGRGFLEAAYEAEHDDL